MVRKQFASRRKIGRWLVAAAAAGMLALPSFAATITLSDPGSETVIDYKKYGSFKGTGTAEYEYKVRDLAGLKKAAGEGVLPNDGSVLADPRYKALSDAGKLNGEPDPWVFDDNPELRFYRWAASAHKEQGVKLYYAAQALEDGGCYAQAVKAYYAVVVQYPRALGYTYWKTTWPIGPVALEQVRRLCREHPELGMKLVGGKITIKNGYDANPANDVFVVDPGKLLQVPPEKVLDPKIDVSALKVVKTVGKGGTKLVQYSNGHWQLLVDGKPYVVRGIAYSPSPIGKSPDFGTVDPSRDWTITDTNRNKRPDGAFEAWVDKNGNNKQDADEPAVGDFQLMKEMGVNTIRVYHFADLDKKVLKEGYEKYGFRYIMGNFLGMYAKDSDADWFYGTDYTYDEHRKNMLASVQRMVEEYKDEPYVLMWMLGNENNYAAPGEEGVSAGAGCRAGMMPADYYAFANEAAKLIKKLDPQQRPVGICNGDLLYLDICASSATAIDVYGVNAYRGKDGFNAIWRNVADTYRRPVLVTEYGCSAMVEGLNAQKSLEYQAAYDRGNWLDIENNLAGSGVGNALGGCVFEWVDEWWKSGFTHKPEVQDPDGPPTLKEEWLGLTSQGDGSRSPFLRQLRPVYFEYKKLWEKYNGANPVK